MGVEQIVMKFVQYSQSICSFDQGFLLKLDAAHAGSKGICYALSSCFILGCLSGKIPEDSFKIISDYNKLDTLVAIQKAYSDFNEDRAGISEEERDKINVEHTFHELMGGTGSPIIWGLPPQSSASLSPARGRLPVLLYSFGCVLLYGRRSCS